MKGETSFLVSRSWPVVDHHLESSVVNCSLAKRSLCLHSAHPDKRHYDPSSEPALQHLLKLRDVPSVPHPCFSRDPGALKGPVICQGSHGQQVPVSKLVRAPAVGPLLFHSIT